MKMKEKSKRNFWLTSEIECMLNLIREVKTTQGSTSTTQTTFAQIAAKMRRRGFSNKSPQQIRRKWFQMKSAYLCYKRGNTERLLLIPEKFRKTIAEFVDSDPPLTCMKIQPDEEVSNEDVKNAQEEPCIPKERSQVKPVKNDPPTESSYYQQRFSKFLTRIENTHKVVMEDFKSMQELLLDYQHKCQAERDANLIHFIRNSSMNFNSYY